MDGVDPYRPFQALEKELFGDLPSGRDGDDVDSESRGADEGRETPDAPRVRRATDEGANPEETIEQLLEALCVSSSRSERRRAFDELVARNVGVGTAVVARLARTEGPWYVPRNLLALLAALPERPRGWTPSGFVHHSHPAVRREALKLLLRWPRRRDWALSRLLEEEDPRSIALGVAAAQGDPPPDAIPLLITVAEDTELAIELRRLAVRALGDTGGASGERRRDGVLDCLLSLTTESPRGWDRLLRRPRLRRSPLLPEALAALHRGWSEDPRARGVLRRAAVDLDGDVRGAAAGRAARASEREAGTSLRSDA